jgi:hypothetical protein
MVASGTFVSQLGGYDDGEIETLPLLVGLAGEALLVAGGYLGGTIVFVYGVRVLKRPERAVGDALVPGRAEGARPVEPSPDAEERPLPR